MSPSHLEMLKSLPHVHGDVWQGGLVRLPRWITEPGRDPYRNWIGAWVSLKSGLMHAGAPARPGDRSLEQVLDAFVEFALHDEWGGSLPERVEVVDTELADRLSGALAALGIAVELRETLHGLERTLQTVFRKDADADEPTGILEAPSVTARSVACFVEAAKLFHEAAPWRLLSDEDLLRVEAPGGFPDMQHGLVLGAAGVEFGLMLFGPARLHEQLLAGGAEAFSNETGYTVFFDSITEIPLGDADLFEDLKLPVAGRDAYPWAARIGPGHRIRRPDGRHLERMEALLRALAQVTESDVDAGRFQRRVETAHGKIEVTVSLPDLVDTQRPDGPMRDKRAAERILVEIQRLAARQPFADTTALNREIAERFKGRPVHEIPSTAATALERAQDLCYEAFDSRGRRRLLLARHALEICPDCADAYVIQAELADDPAEEERLYREGVAAGERALGEKRFLDRENPFWADVTTRSFMRALLGYAHCVAQRGQPREAIPLYQRLIDLNPVDNQGARYALAAYLLEAGDDKTLAELLARFEGDPTATFNFARALGIFRTQGAVEAARAALLQAMECNRHVPAFLLGRLPIPDSPSFEFALGSRDEAVLCALELLPAWRNSPGALEWLEREIT